ncbi:MAG: ATP-dependent DNA helicase DinG [Natronospirillum sp.]|uniref:ATP-dependent DNA helicase DinG n=1 Tax=Natronospirillum sp. TaxID=2812955 RepID=UPI0025D0DBE1|nr:ATP-dependent DNA helicase DinG [Natronospirillum sp.]MCH8552729.1 ATP-dependent DNA helicase DinG [Natronospirillum sp.]
MLTDQQKQLIQQAYRDYLAARELRPRSGQRQMIAHIARRLAGDETLPDSGADDAEERPSARLAVVEAGTGTGKTLGYLIPALVMAADEKKQVVLSTATVALQGQLMDKDLPDLLKHTDLKFDYALGKGRGRFFCEVKTEQARGELSTEATLFDQPAAVTQALLERIDTLTESFAGQQWDGDLDNLEDQPDAALRRAITATSSDCLGALCSRYNECPYFAHRARLKEVDLLVVNHDLVLSDLALGGGVVLPDPAETLFVFDEAHHLPEKALGHFSLRLELSAFRQFIEQVNRHSVKMVSELQAYDDLGDDLSDLEFQARETRDQLRQISDLLDLDWQGKGGSRPVFYRFPLGQVPEPLRIGLIELTQHLKPITGFLNKAHKLIGQQLRMTNPPAGQPVVQSWSQQIGQDLELVQGAVDLARQYQQADAETPNAFWVEKAEGKDDLALMCSPFLAGGVLNHYLWQRAWGAVMTSATLSAGGDFSRFRVHSGIHDETAYLRVPGAFNYAEQGVIWLPANAANAGQQDQHTQDLVQRLPGLLAEHAATLVLFSSRAQMESVYEQLPAATQQAVQCQGQKSREAIIETHQRLLADNQSSAIFGLASFSEGIDLPGSALTQVIIAKLPFSVPDDPLQAASAEWIERRGGNPFMQLTLPEAIIRLTQAVGRLIRKDDDHGRVVILDARVRTARYGSMVLDALPPFRRDFS